MLRAAFVLVSALVFLSPATAADSETDPDLVELLRDLKSEDADTRATAALLIGSMGKVAAKAVPHLVTAADDDSEEVRQNALDSLRHLAPGVPAALDALIKLLKHPRADVRADAADNLGELGKLSRKALPGLGRAALDRDESVSKRAIFSLGTLGEVLPEVVPYLLAVLDKGTPSSVDQALMYVVALGKSEEIPRPTLLKLLRDEREDVWRFAFNMLDGDNDGDAEEAKILAERVRGDGKLLDHLVISRLGRIGRKNPEAVGFLRALLRRESTRDDALSALHRAGAGAKPAVPELLELLALEDPHVQGYVLSILGNIPGADSAVPDLRRFLSHDRRSFRAAAAWALAAVGKGAAPAQEELTKAAAAESAMLRAAAGYALYRITGKLPEGTVKALIASLEKEEFRSHSISALADIGPAAKEAVPVLERLTRHKYYGEEAKAALARIRGE